MVSYFSKQYTQSSSQQLLICRNSINWVKNVSYLLSLYSISLTRFFPPPLPLLFWWGNILVGNIFLLRYGIQENPRYDELLRKALLDYIKETYFIALKLIGA